MSVIVYGAGGMGREVADWAAVAGRDVVGFCDDDPTSHGREVAGLRVLGGEEILERRLGSDVVVAIGAPTARAELAARHAGRLTTFVHPTAVLGSRSHLDPGVVVGPATVLTTDCQVGRAAIINYGTAIGHDGHLGEAVFVGSGVSMAGGVTVGDRAWVGIGAVVLEGVTIGADAVVGAGSVVIDDVAPASTVVGVPARPVGG